MTDKHTPGEWKYSVHTTSELDGVVVSTTRPATLFVVDEYGGEIDIAVFEEWGARHHEAEMIANAKLIAAAPETKAQRDQLLEVCELLVEYLTEAHEDDLTHDHHGEDATKCTYCNAIAQAETAISAAGGKA